MRNASASFATSQPAALPLGAAELRASLLAMPDVTEVDAAFGGREAFASELFSQGLRTVAAIGQLEVDRPAAGFAATQRFEIALDDKDDIVLGNFRLITLGAEQSGDGFESLRVRIFSGETALTDTLLGTVGELLSFFDGGEIEIEAGFDRISPGGFGAPEPPDALALQFDWTAGAPDWSFSGTFALVAVPEPGTGMLVAIGFVWLAGRERSSRLAGVRRSPQQ